MSWDWEKLKSQQSQPKGPPQMDDLIKKFNKIKLPGKIPGGPLIILIILVIFFGSSTFYTVGVDEVGIIQRFGRYIRTTQPG